MKSILTICSIFILISVLAQQDVRSFRKDGKVGLKNSSNETIVNAIYDDIKGFNKEGLAMVVQNGKYGFIDETGKQVIPLVYEVFVDDYQNTFDSDVPFVEGQISAKKNGKFGFIDANGKKRSDFEFDALFNLQSGMALAKKGALWGFVDGDGKELIPFSFESAAPYLNGVSLVKRDGLYGYIDRLGKEVIPIKYNHIQNYATWIRVEKNGKCGYIDKQGQEVLPIVYDNLELVREPKDVVWAKNNNVYGLINAQNEIVLGFDYESIAAFGEQYKVKQNGKFGVIKRDGTLLLTCDYDAISSGPASELYHTLFVEANGSHGLLDRNTGKVLVDIIYEEKLRRLYRSNEEMYFISRLNGQAGVVTIENKVKVPFIYEEVHMYHKDLGKVKVNGGYDLIDGEGNLLTNEKFTSLPHESSIYPSSSMVSVMKDGKYGAVDQQGKQLIPWKFDSISGFRNGESKAVLNGQDVIINERGEILKK